jgi:IS4 transposase
LDSKNIYFVTRPKKNTQYDVFEPYETGAENNNVQILEDAKIGLMDEKAAGDYPQKLRLVSVWDKHKKRELSFLTNNFYWTALTVAELYKSRWEIEVFFKQLKQHLKIKTFIGTTPNAVLIQVWTAMITMLLLKFLKARAKYGWHLSNLITFIRMNLLVKVGLFEWLNNPFPQIQHPPDNQLAIFDTS